MTWVKSVLSCLFFASFASAAPLKSNFMRAESLMTFELSTENPHSTDHLTIYANLVTDYESANEVRVLVRASFDGTEASLLHLAPGLWTLSQDGGLEAGNHTLRTDIYLEDRSETDSLRAAISLLNQQIAALDSLIPAEEDPAQRAIYQADRDSKNNQREALKSDLDQAKTYLGSEDFTFSVQN